VGLLGLVLPQVLQGGYGWIQLAIDGRIALRLLAILIFAKTAAFALTVSSGGSGGVFAPSLFVGAMLGGSFAWFLHQPSAVFVVVGMAAVFGAAARVPVATMLMVTEMAGGFHLLVPAGMAVMIAYLLQDRLSAKLKYRSLYEGQVPSRADSPAHYLEHIHTALSLLGKRDLPITDEIGHIDLMRLLRSHVRFDLPGHNELGMALVPDNSEIAGKPLDSLYRQLDEYTFEVVAIARRVHVLLPRPDTTLEAGDRVLLIAPPKAREALAKFLTPLAQENGTAQTQAAA
jgi:CIC family chloride channel protein